MADMPEVSELRLVVTAPDYEEALRFYRDVLPDPSHAEYVDDVEVGRRVAGHIRIAFQVSDAASATGKLAAAGAEVVAEPTPTPWHSLNSRLEGPAGLQLTLFSDLPYSLSEQASTAGSDPSVPGNDMMAETANRPGVSRTRRSAGLSRRDG
jgi:lactoylglutathione lyase